MLESNVNIPDAPSMSVTRRKKKKKRETAKKEDKERADKRVCREITMHHKPINHARRDAGKKDGELGTEEKEGT